MYMLSRFLILTATLFGAYSAIIIAVLAWPVSGWVIGLLLFLSSVKSRNRHLTTLGSARWADENDLRSRGMLGTTEGLILGYLEPALRSESTTQRVLQLKTPSREACQEFWSRNARRQGQLVRLPQAVHTAVISRTGGGKGVSIVTPFLKTCRDSCVVLDFKGENFLLTAAHRAKYFGHKIVVLDPFRAVTSSPDCFNPLDFFDKDCPLTLDECNNLAKALVLRQPDEKEPHWGDSAEFFIAACAAVVVQYGAPSESRSLQAMRAILAHPERLELAMKLMGESECWDGMLARWGGQLSYFAGKEKSSVLTTVARHLRFLDTMAVAESTKASSYDPADLRAGNLTVYLVVPPEHMRSQAPLLRMWINAHLGSVIRGGLQERNKVHFVLDEAASLGHLESIDDAVEKYRGYGVRLHFLFQSLSQIRKCFPEGQEQTLLSNTSQVFFGVNDYATAEHVSNQLGDGTIVVDSGGSGSSFSSQWSNGAQPQDGGSNSTNSNSSWQQQARRLLKPEEIMTLASHVAITFTPGMSPIRTTLLRYYQEPWLGKSVNRFTRVRRSCSTLAASAILCVVSIGFAALMTLMADEGALGNQGEQLRDVIYHAIK